jgi:chromosome segregation ATPase
MGTISIIALCLAAVSIALSAIAYWRAGGRRDVEALRAQLASELEAVHARERAIAEELRRRVRSGYEDSLARIKRAEERLAQVRETVSAETRQAIDALREQFAEARREIETRLAELKAGASSRAEALQETLQRRVLRMEARAQLIMARADMLRAERLAEKRDFARANDLLEEAVAKVRSVRARLSDPFEDDPAFQNVLDALLEAIRSVRAQAADHERQIERVLSASDALLASLASHEESIA